MKKIALILAALVLLSGISFAAFDKKVTFPGKTQGDITFDHAKHLAVKGTTCKTCHPSIFAKMKSGQNKMTMAEINKGKFCGTCHKLKGKAFEVKNCVKCHIKKK